MHLFLMPGGLFLFDINAPGKLRGLDGGIFLDETEDTYCVWRADWSERRKICTYGMDLFFREEGGLWRRRRRSMKNGLMSWRSWKPTSMERDFPRCGSTAN
ncbi:MAG: hypothetical protein ACLSAF_14520 [Intestinimonas sp.]